MLVTTTLGFEGKRIVEYKGLAFGVKNGMLMVSASRTAVIVVD